jgi:tubulin monoglycylase TTLL3/8
LTNDAVQKKCDDYGKFEYGNKVFYFKSIYLKVSFEDFSRYIEKNYNSSFFNDLYPKIKEISIDSIKSVFFKLDPFKRINTFEVESFNNYNFKVIRFGFHV